MTLRNERGSGESQGIKEGEEKPFIKSVREAVTRAKLAVRFISLQSY